LLEPISLGKTGTYFMDYNVTNHGMLCVFVVTFDHLIHFYVIRVFVLCYDQVIKCFSNKMNTINKIHLVLDSQSR
jgi:hypothetical protein